MAMLPVLLALLAVGAQSRGVSDSTSDPFALPEGFLIGAGVSGIQTEGAWNLSGKAESAADHVLHLGKLGPLGFGDPHAHDTAANSYYRYKEDIEMAKKLKLNLYRFSISWSRVLPDTNASNPNMEGVQYYHDLIDEILRNNMTPLATLHHFDHPRILEDQFKGWQGEEMVAKFKEYARFAFNEYAGKVKLWVTVNEANMYCLYFPNLFNASGIYTDSDLNRYECIRHTLLAHAEAYHVFKEDNHEGRVGCSALLTPARPNSTRSEDVYAADAYNDLQAGLVIDPLVHGDWPEYVKDLGGSKVPAFSEAEKQLMKGALDFIAINVYYTSTAAYKIPDGSPSRNGGGNGMILNDLPNVVVEYDSGDSFDLLFYTIQPDAMRMALLWTWQKYGRPIFVSENGLGDSMHLGKNDEMRAAYHSAYLRTMVQTVKDYGVEMVGYSAWSLIDCFEWSAAYSRPFGLVHVDYETGSLNRSLKASSKFWIEMGETGVVPYVEIPLQSTPAPPTASPAPPTASPAPASSTPRPTSTASISTTSWLLSLILLATSLNRR